MSGIATAIVGSAVIGGYSSSKAADAQASASDASVASQERIATEQLALQKELAEQQRSDFAPWRETGEQALSQLWSGIQSGAFDVGNVDVTQDPGYQFRMDQGVEALDKSAAAKGLLLSGAQQTALTDYGQSMGSQEYANAYARQANEKANQYNMLSGLSSSGQASAAGQAQATSNLSNASTNTLTNLASAQSQAAYNTGQARAGAYQGMATSANQGIQNWLTYQNG